MIRWLLNLFLLRHQPERGDVYSRSYEEIGVVHVDQVVLLFKVDRTWWAVRWDEGDGRNAGFVINPNDWTYAGFKRDLDAEHFH